ncbi:CcdB family protein [Mesorhizobium sp. AA22]|uniref:CcdB family protein n=1 Tax=Mesorhizobium sp. AA22 TaxID=1854057 RepID=UPI001FEE7B3B|nr:CcdB family protein [Mesorhizobium sp. AA22]
MLDVQADLLKSLNTRVVIPLMPPTAPVPGRRLNPTFTINGSDHVMVTEFISALMGF